MSFTSNPSFGIFSFLTRLIPGAVLTFSIYYVFNGNVQFIYSLTPFSILAITAGLYVVGEMIEFFRVWIFYPPKPFKRILYSSTGNIQHLGLLGYYLEKYIYQKFSFFDGNLKTKSIFEDNNSNLWDPLVQDYDFIEEYGNTVRIYDVFSSGIDPQISTSTRRIRRSYIFFKNLHLSVSMGLLFVIIALAVSGESGLGFRPSRFVLYLLVALLFFYVYWLFFNRISEIYVGSMINEYYKEVKKK